MKAAFIQFGELSPGTGHSIAFCMKLNARSLTGLLVTTAAASLGLNFNAPLQAETCNYDAGQAVGGQRINVDLCSISRVSQHSNNFVYYLGGDRVSSQANCRAGTWTTFPEKAVHRPQSQATQNMLNIVCSYIAYSPTIAVVVSPPSNVRSAPDGKILCSVKERKLIHVYGATGSWYYTNVCGQIGVIHSSQIRF